MNRVSHGYVMLPGVYDSWQKSYGNDFSDLILPRLLATIRVFVPEGKRLLDLACGTGTMALMMARRGWCVWGVDGSAGMLKEARRKSLGSGVRVHFSRQDMRGFRLREKVDLVTCLFDSLNHLPSVRGLHAAFRSVRGVLREGGYFMFDVNNEHCFRTLWDDTDTIRLPVSVMHLTSSYDPLRRRARARIRVADAGQGKHWTETVYERFFSDDEIRRGLAAAGFEVCTVEDFNFTDMPSVGKIKTWWVARRRAAALLPRPASRRPAEGSSRSMRRQRG